MRTKDENGRRDEEGGRKRMTVDRKEKKNVQFLHEVEMTGDSPPPSFSLLLLPLVLPHFFSPLPTPSSLPYRSSSSRRGKGRGRRRKKGRVVGPEEEGGREEQVGREKGERGGRVGREKGKGDRKEEEGRRKEGGRAWGRGRPGG